MLASIFRFSNSELATGLSDLFSVWLAVFGEGTLHTIALALCFVSLLLSITPSLRCVRRATESKYRHVISSYGKTG